MKINPQIFRAYDLRGLVGSELSSELALNLGKAYVTYMHRFGINEFVVGRDSRASGKEYSDALIKGMLFAGGDVVDIGMNLVGTFYWSQYFLKRRGGIYVSASHNPPEYNGFKIARDYSETFVEDGMKAMKEMVQNDEFEAGSKPGVFKEMDIRKDYFKDVLKRIPIEKKLKVVIDPSHSTAGAIAPELLRLAGMEVIEKHCEVDSSFPLGVADPTSSIIAERLKKEVLESGADVGFSYDADGDRIGIVDEKGNIIWNDVLVALFAKDVLSDHKGATIMYNILCSKTTKEVIESEGGKPFMWRVGHSFLKKKNQEIKAAFIGELSGHFFFSKDFHNHDDGLYSTMRLLRLISRSGLTLSQLVASLPKYISSPEIKIYCADDKKSELMKKLSPILRGDYPNAEVVDDERAGDGIRLETDSSMFVIRYSQNGPYITIKFEAKTDAEYQDLKKYIKDLLSNYSEIDWNHKINLNTNSFD